MKINLPKGRFAVAAAAPDHKSYIPLFYLFSFIVVVAHHTSFTFFIKIPSKSIDNENKDSCVAMILQVLLAT